MARIPLTNSGACFDILGNKPCQLILCHCRVPQRLSKLTQPSWLSEKYGFLASYINIHHAPGDIERVIKQQPSSYNTVPYDVAANSDCIVMRMTEQGGWGPFQANPGNYVNSICYRNIGKVTLNKTDIFYVEVYDRAGNWLCYVYSFDESEAKLFIDALHTMMAAK
jgi:hypothetical protein